MNSTGIGATKKYGFSEPTKPVTRKRAWVESIESELKKIKECPVCYLEYEMTRDPRVLKCGHIICNICLKALYLRRRKEIRAERKAGGAPDRYNICIKCVICRAPSPTPVHSIHSPRDRNLFMLIMFLKEGKMDTFEREALQNVKDQITCQTCQKPFTDRRYPCVLRCGDSICHDCLTGTLTTCKRNIIPVPINPKTQPLTVECKKCEDTISFDYEGWEKSIVKNFALLQVCPK